MFRYLRLVLPMVALAAAAGCGPDYSPNTYSTAAVQQANKVDQGVIAGFREIAIRADGTVGAVAGGAAGGVLGAQAPDGGVITALSAIGGTLVGGIIGTGVEHATDDTKAFEYLVRKTNGDLLSVTQKDATPLPVGLKVLVIEGKQARVVADYSVPPEAPAPQASPTAKSDKTNAVKTNQAEKTDITPKADEPNGATPPPSQAPQATPADTQPAPEPHAAGSEPATQAPASQAQAPSAPAPQQPAPAAEPPPPSGDQGGGDQGGSTPPASEAPAQAPAPDSSKSTP